MNAAIIAVGSEMLTPGRVDTNSLFLTEHLNALGVEVTSKHVAGDDRVQLAALIKFLLATTDMVILTGGLGPTEDDVTRDAVAAALGIELRADPAVLTAIAARFARLGRTMAANNARQALILEGAEVMENPRGTAPGQLWQRGSKIVVLLPGPPGELKPLVEATLLRRLREMLPPAAIALREFRVARMPESELDALIAPVYSCVANPATTVLAKVGDIEIHLRARGETSAAAEACCDEVGDKIAALLGSRIYSRNGDPLETVVGRRLEARGESVAVAESCTGGMLGARLTETAGSAAWFRGGFIVYHKDLKVRLIGEFEEDCVSEPVARKLAQACRERSSATWGVAITGYAGPDGAEPGVVWIGIAGPADTVAHRFQFFRDRHRDRTLAVQTALDLLRLKIL